MGARRTAPVNGGVPSLTIRQYGDPVLKERTREIEKIDGGVANLVESMIETMYDAPGTGLAANQVGVQRRIFVYDIGDGPVTVINPRIVESDGEWIYDEGCLSIPGLSWDIVRPNAVHLVGVDLDGNEISLEATELEGRVFQHELDHLDGILLVERLDDDQRKEALKILRSRTLDLPASDPDGLTSLISRAERLVGRTGPALPAGQVAEGLPGWAVAQPAEHERRAVGRTRPRGVHFEVVGEGVHRPGPARHRVEERPVGRLAVLIPGPRPPLPDDVGGAANPDEEHREPAQPAGTVADDREGPRI